MATQLPPLRLTALLQFLLLTGVFAPNARSDLVISRADRKVDLTSHIVRVLSSLKVENVGSEPVSQVLLAFPNVQAKNLAAIRAFGTEGKVKGPSTVLPIEVVQPSEVPPELQGADPAGEEGRRIQRVLQAQYRY